MFCLTVCGCYAQLHSSQGCRNLRHLFTLCLQPQSREVNAGAHTMSAATGHTSGCWCSHCVCSHGTDRWMLLLTLCLQPWDIQVDAGAHTVSAAMEQRRGCWCSHCVCSHGAEKWMLVLTLCLSLVLSSLSPFYSIWDPRVQERVLLTCRVVFPLHLNLSGNALTDTPTGVFPW